MRDVDCRKKEALKPFTFFQHDFQSHEGAGVAKDQKLDRNNEEDCLCHKKKMRGDVADAG